MANLINCKSQWPWSICVSLGHLDASLAFFNKMFGLSHGQKSHVSQMFHSKITHAFHAPGL